MLPEESQESILKKDGWDKNVLEYMNTNNMTYKEKRTKTFFTAIICAILAFKQGGDSW